MKHLYFCRHGQSQANVDHLWGGQTDAPLTNEGRDQAKLAGEKLKASGTQIDLMIASPLSRAHDTALIIATEIGYPTENIRVIDQFQERSFGDMDGKPDTVEFLKTHNYQGTDDFPHVETVEALQKRAADGLDYLQSLPEQNILLVGHGAYGRGLIRVINGQPYTQEFEVENVMSVIPNARVIQLI